MARHPLWQDHYWLLLMQLYLKRPQGVKAQYSRGVVDLALELHIEPEFLYRQMFRLRQLDTPRIQLLWEKYAEHPRRLTHAIALLRKMSGFGNYEEFYEGVEVNESWELDFKPIEGQNDENAMTPAMLIVILDLYFRLVPDTMIAETPEIVELAKLIGTSPKTIEEVMEVFRFCDPLLTQGDIMIHPWLNSCMAVWKRFGNESPEKLAAHAAQLKEYWR